MQEENKITKCSVMLCLNINTFQRTTVHYEHRHIIISTVPVYLYLFTDLTAVWHKHYQSNFRGFIKHIQPAISVGKQEMAIFMPDSCRISETVPWKLKPHGNRHFISVQQSEKQLQHDWTDNSDSSVSTQGLSVWAGTNNQTSRLVWPNDVIEPPVQLIFFANKWCAV